MWVRSFALLRMTWLASVWQGVELRVIEIAGHAGHDRATFPVSLQLGHREILRAILWGGLDVWERCVGNA